MNIALLGYGVVGKGVAMIINSHPEYSIHIKSILMEKEEWCTQENMTTNYDVIIQDPSIEIVVECIGGLEPAHSFAVKALKSGKSYISSNKKMIAHFYDELVQLANENHVYLRFSSAVGGGIPWLEQLNSIKQREEIIEYEGIMNGTSNYILDKITTEGTDFATALENAQKLGYAERDPSDDIDGIDTANKTVLSGNLAFDGIFNVDDMLIKGIRYFSDDDYNFCKINGYRCVLRGVGKKQDGLCGIAVYPCFVKENNLLASIRLNYNCFMVNSTNLTKLSFVGEGAGRFPTASNVAMDILKIQSKQGFVLKGEAKKNSDEILISDFYVRSKDIQPFDTSNKEIINEDSIIIKQVSVQKLREMLAHCKDKEVFIAGVIND